MNQLDLDYQNLLKDILENGIRKDDRTGTGTLSIFGRQIRHKMSNGFPLLTTKKMYWKGIVTELMWFLRGDTNIKYLVDNDCHIWDGDTYKKFFTEASKIKVAYECGDLIGTSPYVEEIFSDSDKLIILTKEEFINKIKHDDKFAEEWGELGPIYGKQWRNWFHGDWWMNGSRPMTETKQIDQIQNLIDELKTNPDSRRLMVSAWNVGELDQMVLPPCHYGFQCWTRELSEKERIKILHDRHGDKGNHIVNGFNSLDELNIPERSISLMWNQRSCDFPLGIPANIMSYGILLMMLAKQVNMIPDELIGNFGDCHIYLNQVDGVKEQLTREPFPLPTVKLSDRVIGDLSEYEYGDIILENYISHPKIYFPLSN